MADGWVKLPSSAHFLFHVWTSLVPDLRHHLLTSRCILSWTNTCPIRNRFQVFPGETLRYWQHVVCKVILGSLDSFRNAKTPRNTGPQHQDPGSFIGNMLPHTSLHICHLFPQLNKIYPSLLYLLHSMSSRNVFGRLLHFSKRLLQLLVSSAIFCFGIFKREKKQ